MIDLSWVQKIIPKDVREHPTIAVIAIIFLIRGFVATPDDVQAVNDKLKASVDSISVTVQKQAYETRREIQIAFVHVELNRLRMELKHMEAYVDYGKANKYQSRRHVEIPNELKRLDEKLTLIMLATYPQPFISVTRGQ